MKLMMEATTILKFLYDLDGHLKVGKLPHYFLTQCNLLETVKNDELCVARQFIVEIFSDPLNALLTSTTYPQQIYGEVQPDDLVVAFSRASSHPTSDQSWKRLSELLPRVDEKRRQRYTWQRERDQMFSVSGQAELTELIDTLK